MAQPCFFAIFTEGHNFCDVYFVFVYGIIFPISCSSIEGKSLHLNETRKEAFAPREGSAQS